MENIYIKKSSGMGFVIIDKTDVFYKLKNICNNLEFNVSKEDFETRFYQASLIEALDFKEFYKVELEEGEEFERVL